MTPPGNFGIALEKAYKEKDQSSLSALTPHPSFTRTLRLKSCQARPASRALRANRDDCRPLGKKHSKSFMLRCKSRVCIRLALALILAGHES